MLRRVRAAFATPWLLALIMVSLGLGTLAFQVGGNYSISPAEYSNHLYFQGFEPPEGQPDSRFRWSLPASCICLKGIGAYPMTLHLRIAGVYPAGTIRRGRVLVNNHPIGDFTLTGGIQDFSAQISRDQVGPTGDFNATIDIVPLDIQGDPRPLGVQVSAVDITRVSGRYVWPAPAQLGVMLLAAFLLYLGLLLLGITARGASIAAISLSGLWALGLALARFPVAAGATRMVPVLLAAFISTVAVRLLADWLFHRGEVRATRIEWLVLCLTFAWGVLFKAGGMFHPAFLFLDHVARLHQLAIFGIDPAHFLETYLAAPPSLGLGHQLELGTAIPYSPFFYIVFSPLNILIPEDYARLDMLNIIISILESLFWKQAACSASSMS